MKRFCSIVLLLATCVAGCGKSSESDLRVLKESGSRDTEATETGDAKYVILGTITDQGKPEVAQAKAEDALNTYPDINAMVGLFEYNPPACYQALEKAGKLGKVKLIGFDENDITLQAIKDGTCAGTVVQNPYMYGYESVRVLKDLLDGKDDVVPQSKYLDIPPRTITRDNVDEFWADLKAKKSPVADSGESSESDKSVAFITNQIADFWKISEAGCIDAEKDFGVEVEVRMPSQATAVEQKRIVEDLLTSGVQAIAISPIDADNQVDWLDGIAEKVPLITHDSDAPGAKRLMYIGMDNYAAGRACGELVKQALPDGGKVMLFIGRLEQDNSKLRRQGVIDVLLDRDRDLEYYRSHPDSWDQ